LEEVEETNGRRPETSYATQSSEGFAALQYACEKASLADRARIGFTRR
jgi:hypothetical protein